MASVNLKSEKNMGMWGAILSLISGLLFKFGLLLGLVGWLLVLFSLKGIGDKLNDDRPFKNYLYAFIAAVIFVVILVAVLITAIVVGSTTSSWGIGPFHPGYIEALGVGVAIFIVALVIGMVVVVGYFMKRTWEAMYELTGTEDFKKAATWYWWGALTVIVLVGVVLLLIAEIYVILGFNNMPEEIGEENAANESILW